jgi:hypothetical protein
VLNLIWIVMQWLLVIALVLFFIAPLMSETARAWKLRFASGAILLGVFAVAALIVEIRVHPVLSVIAFAIAAFASYGALEFRRRMKLRKPEPFIEYLNLRSMGKRPVDVSRDHPDAFQQDEAPEDERHESA